MITHVVMWKFLEGTEEKQTEFLTRLEGLYGVIDVIRDLTVYRTAKAGGEYDAILVSKFDTLADVDTYKNDPRHLEVASLCKDIRTSRAAIDYEE